MINTFKKAPSTILWSVLIVLFMGLVATGMWFSSRHSDVDIKGVRYFSSAVKLNAFQLNDHNQQSFDNQRLAGQWNILFFGYTHCPDICPTVMLDMAKVYDEYVKQQNAKDLQVVFVSVDPNRDTLEQLKNYVTYFNPNFLGVTGERQQIDAFTKSVGAMYDFEDRISGEVLTGDQVLGKQGYIVNHYAAVILVNPEGEMVA
ncbi:SCO family protein, partial [Kaarinaea lacus]